MPKSVKSALSELEKAKGQGIGTTVNFGEPEGNEPVFTALTVLKVGAHYACAELKVQGERVLSVTLDEPNSRAIANDCFKIAAQKKVLD